MKKIFGLLLILTSCSFLIQNDDDGPVVLNNSTKKLSLIFSHNIHAETHPCGCRHHPLGGLPQVAGKMEEIRSDHPIYYVDTGDTLYDTVKIPKNLRKSMNFKAKNLAKGLDQMGLKLFTPGDQDFSAGVKPLRDIFKNQSFFPLISNLKDKNTFGKLKEFQILKSGPHSLFFFGIIDPQVFTIQSQFKSLFLDPDKSIQQMIEKLKGLGYNADNPFHRLILMSHSGMANDISFAKKYPMIDWIIGSHTQSFTVRPRVVGETKIVQVLSRNHQLGEIVFDFTASKKKDHFKIHEIRDELKDKLKPNPFISFIDEHKAKLSKIQLEEQQTILNSLNLSEKAFPHPTAQSCVECHAPQTDFWSGTAHALAYQTLMKAKEPYNLTCIKCHSVGLGDIQGFSTHGDMVKFHDSIEKSGLEYHKKAYWSQLNDSLQLDQSVREMKPEERKRVVSRWFAHDKDYKVEYNYANVQCLNCHDKTSAHPFDSDQYEKADAKTRFASMQKKCLSCHNSDQSPEWFNKDSRGLPSKVNELILVQKMKEVACPSMDEVE